MAQAQAINQMGKTRIRNLQYRLRKRGQWDIMISLLPGWEMISIHVEWLEISDTHQKQNKSI